MAINPLSSLAVAAASTLLAKANTGPGALAVGKVVALTDIDALDSLFPYVVKASLAKASDASIADAQLALLVSRMAGSGSVADGDLLILAREGPLSVAYTGPDPAAGDPVFVNNTGDIKLVAGDNSRGIGKVMGHGGGQFSFWFTGLADTGGGGGTPGDAPYLLDTDTLPSGFSGSAARLLQNLITNPLALVRTDQTGSTVSTVLALGSASHAAEMEFVLTPDTGPSMTGPYASVVATIGDNPSYGSEVSALEFWTYAHGSSYNPRVRVNGLGLQLKNSTGGGDMGVLKTDSGDLVVGGDHVSAGLRLRSGGVDRWRLINNTGVLRSLGGSSSSSGTAAPLDLRNDQGGPGANGIGVSLFASVSNSVSSVVGAAGLIMQLRDVTDGAEQGQLIFAATRPSLSPYLATWDHIDGLVLDTAFTAGADSSMGGHKLVNVAPGTASMDAVNAGQVSMPMQLVFGARSTITPHAGAVAAFDELCRLGTSAVAPTTAADPSSSFLVPTGASFVIQRFSVLAGSAPVTADQSVSLYITDGVTTTLLSSATIVAGDHTGYDGTVITVPATGGPRVLIVTYAQAAGGTLAGNLVANVLYSLV